MDAQLEKEKETNRSGNERFVEVLSHKTSEIEILTAKNKELGDQLEEQNAKIEVLLQTQEALENENRMLHSKLSIVEEKFKNGVKGGREETRNRKYVGARSRSHPVVLPGGK